MRISDWSSDVCSSDLDLHPHQLPTRYLATYAFYRHGYPDSASRLRTYLAQEEGAVMDEPATARALAWFVLRGVQCEIGRASCRERVCQHVYNSVVAVSVTTKKHNTKTNRQR